MKWRAIAALGLAIIVRFAWHGSVDVGFGASASNLRAYPASAVLEQWSLALGWSKFQYPGICDATS